MKRFSLFILLLCISSVLFSQKRIENPKHGLTTAPNLKITEIVLADSITSLSFKITGNPGAWILIPGGSCIQAVGSDERYYVKRTEGIPLGKKYTFDNLGEIEYKVIFPAIDRETARIDFLEDNDGGSWFIYDIRLKEDEKVGKISADLQNIWFDSSGSKQMTIALYDTVAVYQSQLWKYGKVEQKGKTTKVELMNDKGRHTLYFESTNEHICKMGTGKKKLLELYDWPMHIEGYKLPGDDPYSLPILKNGMATFSGYIRDFTTRAGFTTGLIHMNNAVVGKQESYSIKIQDNGYFTVSIPMINPEEVYLDIPLLHRTVFLEPGKETFQLVDGASVYNGLLFQGEMAPVNNGLFELKDIRYLNYQELRDSILNMSAEQYKAYIYKIRDREMEALNDTVAKKFISVKARQVKEMNIKYSCIENLLSYSMTYRGALQRKNGNKSRVKMDDIPQPELSYYDFLTSDLLNDELGMLSIDYYIFTNRLKYADILRAEYRTQMLDHSKLAEFIQSKGVEFTPEEERFIETQIKLDEQRMDWESFNEKYSEVRSEFFKKYGDTIKELSEDPNFVLWYDIEDVVLKSGGEISAIQKEMLLAVQKQQSRTEMLDIKNIQLENRDALNEFNTKYRSYQSDYFNEMRENARAVALKEKLGVEGGLVVDVMYAQDQLRGIVEELTPVSNEELVQIAKKVNTPFIADYIGYRNGQTIKRVAELKEMSGYVVNQTPSVDSDLLFEKMMEKFKGKVVFVDFWATWCGPCRSGMQRMKPLKADLADRDIVFVYITNDTSPETAWSNMVAEIGGEHYKLSKDEWNILSERFGISGIPHYVLVDKEGEVAKNNGMPTYNEKEMRKLFEEFLAK
ncbi:MAG: TlpA family protein disulfide reductase [Prolixibacteraceae bacterium]